MLVYTIDVEYTSSYILARLLVVGSWIGRDHAAVLNLFTIRVVVGAVFVL